MLGEEQQRRHERGRSIVWPLLLIFLGGLLLLNNMGVLPWSIWQTLWRFWPVVLVLIGLELILGRGNPWLSALLAILTIGLIGMVALVVAFVPWSSSASPRTAVAQQEVQVPLDDAREATVNLHFAAGRLDVAALAPGSGSLLEGSVRQYRGDDPGIEVQTVRNAGAAEVTIKARQDTVALPAPGGLRWQLWLNPSVPLNLRLEGGAAEIELDLRDLHVRDLYAQTGAASALIRLPQAAGETSARLKAGMAELRVEVPQGVAARIVPQGGLATVDVDESRFPKRGDVYVSPDYDSAANRVDIKVEAGMASVTVR